MNEKMTLLLYDYHELEERASSHLRVWKAWHTILYILAAIFGILNYTFLQSTMQMVEDRCVLYPYKLEFQWVELSVITDANADIPNTSQPDNVTEIPMTTVTNVGTNNVTGTVSAQTTTAVLGNASSEGKAKTVKRETNETKLTTFNETTIEDSNATIITENSTSRLFLDPVMSFFASESDCQYAEYMPIMSTVLAILWATLFILCPGGGRTSTSSGLQQSWRILSPALLFALVLVGLTGHSFTSTNGGLQAFCAAFYNVTNTTTCSAVNPFILRGWNATWGMGSRVAATRAAAAGMWVSWACAAALLLARCLAAPDFAVRRTAAYLKDPKQKLTPYLLKTSPRQSQRSTQSSPSKRDTASVKSEPTTTTELVTASVDHGHESELPSLSATPVKRERKGEDIEMTYSPQELNGQR